jgi:hypothetical protein
MVLYQKYMSDTTKQLEESLVAKKVKASERPHYVNNADFSKAVVEYVTAVKKALKTRRTPPPVTEYLGTCLLKIAEGLSRKPNFIRYTYREDMVMDGIENCLKAINNFDVNTGTRTGLPNAFAYFTQICFFAFIRRIQKEKKCQDVKLLYMEHAGIESFANFGEDHVDNSGMGEGIVERIRHKVEQLHHRDAEIKKFGKKVKKTKKKESSTHTLELFAENVIAVAAGK